MTIRFLLSQLLLLVAVVSCSPAIQVTTEPAAGFQLSDYETFAFYDVDASGDGLGDAYQPQVDYLKQEVAKQLGRRGLTRSASEPDLLVNLGVVVEEEVQTRETDIRSDPPQYIGQRRYTWRSKEVEVGRYKEGTVSVHLVDRGRNELVWQGTAETILRSKPDKLQEQMAKGMEKLFGLVP